MNRKKASVSERIRTPFQVVGQLEEELSEEASEEALDEASDEESDEESDETSELPVLSVEGSEVSETGAEADIGTMVTKPPSLVPEIE